jgi:hypothetical protein
MNSRERLIKQYEQIIEDEVYSNEEEGIDINVLYGVARALKEGMGPEHFEEERDINMQHMDRTYFRSIRWTWDKAIRATKKDLEKAVTA